MNYGNAYSTYWAPVINLVGALPNSNPGPNPN